MKQLLASHSIARRLQLGVGIAAGLVLGLSAEDAWAQFVNLVQGYRFGDAQVLVEQAPNPLS